MAAGDPTLLPGERVIWRGRPYQGLIFRPIEAAMIPFSLLWAGFAVFWNVQAWGAADWTFRLFGLPFLAAGLYITIGRFVIDIAIRRGLAYAVTDRRILITRRGGARTTSLDIDRLPALEVDERRDGSGTIRFGAATSIFAGNGFGTWQPSLDPTPQFLRIPDVARVHALIRQRIDAR